MQTSIQTPTPKLEQTFEYYKRLGFSHLSEFIISDGKAIIEINPDRKARLGIKFYQASWKDLVEELMKSITVLKTDEGYMTADPSGTLVYLIETSESLPAIGEEFEPGILGNYMGISIESISMQACQDFYKHFDYLPAMGGADQGWLVLAHKNGTAISIMAPNSCPHLFFSPSLTYFNSGENLAVIEKIRANKVEIVEEISHFNSEGIVDNVIIRDPGGLGFFIFND